MQDLHLGRPSADCRVVVAMSGGVDSACTAALLVEAGFEVVGITLQLYDHGAALGRKGAYELRAIARESGLELLVAGRELEGEKFWDQVTISRPQANPLDEVGLVVLPAFVEHQPRRLLQAVASGIPVIASTACGLQHVKGVISIPTGNAEVLSQEIERLLFAEQVDEDLFFPVDAAEDSGANKQQHQERRD